MTDLLLGPPGAVKRGELPALQHGVIGVTGSPEAGYVLHTTAGKSATAIKATVLDGLPSQAAALVSTRQGSVTTDDLQRAWDALNRLEGSMSADIGAYAVDVDPAAGRIVVDVGTDRVDEATAALGSIDPKLIEIRPSGEVRRLVRTTVSTAPHIGGGVRIRIAQTDPDDHCTSGFTVVRNDTGNYNSLTAAHCGYNNGRDLYSGTNFYGSLAGVNFPDYDVARVAGSTYERRIYTSDGQPWRSVIGADDTYVGDHVCQSGAVSEVECNIRVGTLAAKVCDPSCTYGLARGWRNDDIIGRGGDSGGPIYDRFENQRAGVRGTVVAGQDCNAFADCRLLLFEQWRFIAHNLDVSIASVG